MLADYFCKLGYRDDLFYRSVSKSKCQGGMIPLVEGIIIRMFTIKNKNLTSNFVEILLPEGYCITMKICLSSQLSLIELFRLYYCYHFLRIKKNT